jgi:hypothetical protein
MTTTGIPRASSVAAMDRPSSTGMRIVSKYPGLTA